MYWTLLVASLFLCSCGTEFDDRAQSEKPATAAVSEIQSVTSSGSGDALEAPIRADRIELVLRLMEEVGRAQNKVVPESRNRSEFERMHLLWCWTLMSLKVEYWSLTEQERVFIFSAEAKAAAYPGGILRNLRERMDLVGNYNQDLRKDFEEDIVGFDEWDYLSAFEIETDEAALTQLHAQWLTGLQARGINLPD
ncbi:MAG: hypothetical protein QME74_07840 [Candidatus Edwardsbacteria bacterium]|nr:hypothetical protein [Candidatus Edwardsbacteria bacterium]